MKKFTNSHDLSRRFLIVGTIMACVSLATSNRVRADALLPVAPAEKADALDSGNGTVRGNRCNVRARPTLNSETIPPQLNKGDVVQVLERKTVTEGSRTIDWLRIKLPENAKCYVLGKFVVDGVMTGDDVNVRCGPGTNYRDVGKIAKGEKVTVIGKKGDWMQINPTADCNGWIAAELVEIAPPPPPPPTPATTEVVTPPVAVPPTPAPVAPQVQIVDTDPEVRVQYVIKIGVVYPLQGENVAPGSYELRTPAINQRDYRICLLEAPQINLNRYEGKSVRVYGNERWRKGERWPTLIADRVDMIW